LAARAVEVVAELDEDFNDTDFFVDEFATAALKKWDCEFEGSIEVSENTSGEIYIKINTLFLPVNREVATTVKFYHEKGEWFISNVFNFQELDSRVRITKVTFKNKTITLYTQGTTTYGETELVQKAVVILAALDEDYDSAVEQVVSQRDCPRGRGDECYQYMRELFKNSNIECFLKSVCTNIYESSVEIPICFSDFDSVLFVTVRFIEIDGELVAYHLHVTEG